jgi:hypothetical protein
MYVGKSIHSLCGIVTQYLSGRSEYGAWDTSTGGIGFVRMLGTRLLRVGSRDSVVCIANAYGLEDRRGRISSPGSVKSFLHVIQTGSAPPPPTHIQWGTVASFPGVKRQRREADHSRPTGAEVKKM